jgi:TonB dependent receptor/Carboxypeptidase regulatory-like domain
MKSPDGAWPILALALASVLWASSSASADTSRVSVRVRDASDRPLARADVSLKSAGQSRTAVSDSDGWAIFGDVAPGTVRIRVEAARLSAAQGDVPLPPGEDVVLEAALAPDARRSRLLLATRHGAGSRTFFGEELRDLPSSGSVWSLIETVETEALSDRIEGGGLGLGSPAHISARGSSFTQTSFRLGDDDVTDPRGTGAPLLDLGAFALDGLDVQTALLPVDQGPPGALVTLLPRPASDDWHGGATAVATDDRLQAPARRDGAPTARIGSFDEGSAFLSGPIVARRLKLMVSGGVARSRTFERSAPIERTAQRRFVGGGLEITPSDADEVSLQGGAESTEALDRASFLQAHASWRRRGRQGSSWLLLGSYDQGRFEQAAVVSGVAAERMDGPIPELVHFQSETSRRARVVAQVEPWFGGRRHRPLVGVSVSHSQADGQPRPDAVLIPELVAGQPARLWDYRYPSLESTRTLLELAAYAADRIAISDRLTVDLGARVEQSRGSARGSVSSVQWRGLAPRASARWSPFNKGHLNLLVGYARYLHRLPLGALAYGDPASPQASVSLWNDANGDRAFQPGERGALVARVGPGGGLASIDPRLRPPRTDEALFAIESRIGGDWLIRFVGVRRRERDLVAPVNVGVTSAGYVRRQIPDPLADLEGATVPVYDRVPSTFGLDRYELTNPEAHRTLHEGYELTIEKTLAHRLDFLLAGTGYRTRGQGGNAGFHISENDQGVLGETFADPNVGTPPNSRLFYDRSYTLKIASRYRAPGDFRLGVVARYEDGQPFGRWLLVPDLRQGPLLVEAFARGRSRFTFALTVDARVEKGFRWGATRAAAFVEGFNVLNTANEVEEDVLTSPSYRTVIARQPPRIVRAGLRVEF